MSKLRAILTDHPFVTILSVISSIVTIMAFWGISQAKTCNGNDEIQKPKPPKDTVISDVKPIVQPVKITVSYSKISGHVYDNMENPLNGVRLIVTSVSKEVLTNQSGYFEFEIAKNLSKGEYTITFKKENFETAVQTYFEIPKTDIVIHLDPIN